MNISNEAKIRVTIDGKEAEISVKDLGKTIEKAMKKANEEGKKLKSTFSKIGDFSQRLYFTMQSLKIIKDRAMEMSQLALKTADVKRSFDTLVPPGFLKELRENVKGTVNDFTLMQKTVEAMDLGATTEQIRTFSQFARLEALRKGGDTATRFGEIISGVLRGSTELLDNFGINLTQLNKKIEELAGGRALGAVERRSLSVEAAVQIMNERMKAFGDIAVSDTEKAKQQAVTWENLNVVGGRLLNLFIMPLYNILQPIGDFISNIDTKMQMMLGTVGLTTIGLTKLLPLLKGLGITSSLALGPIGVLITAVGLLYTAYRTNFMGIGDILKTFTILSKEVFETYLNPIIRYHWELWVKFFNWLEPKIKSYYEYYIKMAKVIIGLLGWVQPEIKALYDYIVNKWSTTLEEVKTKTKSSVPDFQKIGKVIGTAFGDGIADGIDYSKYPQKAKKTIVEIVGELADKDIKEALQKEKPVSREMNPWEQTVVQMQESWGTMANIAQGTYAVIDAGMNQLSRGIVGAMFGAKVKFKDIWKSIAKDFLQLFVQEILRYVARILVPKLLSLLLLFDKRQNDMMALKMGQDYAKFFTQGVMSAINPSGLAMALAGGGGFNDGNIVRQLNNTNSTLRNIQSQLNNQGKIINQIVIGEDDVYQSVNNQRHREKIRLGEDVNQRNFT